jgi:hypothetical protein
MDLSRLAATLSDQGADAPLPVETWHPKHCGAMDLVIRADGSWWHEGSRIGRPRLIRLLSRVLRRDDDGYVLVTPAEKLSIEVEDVPFLAVDVNHTAEGFSFRTNVGDEVFIDAAHPVRMAEVQGLPSRAPYVLVRGRLEARVDRAAYYRLVEMLPVEGDALVLKSGGARFELPVGDDT